MCLGVTWEGSRFGLDGAIWESGVFRWQANSPERVGSEKLESGVEPEKCQPFNSKWSKILLKRKWNSQKSRKTIDSCVLGPVERALLEDGSDQQCHTPQEIKQNQS